MGCWNHKELSRHIGHDIQCVDYAGENVAVECHTCHEIILDYDREESEDQCGNCGKTLLPIEQEASRSAGVNYCSLCMAKIYGGVDIKNIKYKEIARAQGDFLVSILTKDDFGLLNENTGREKFTEEQVKSFTPEDMDEIAEIMGESYCSCDGFWVDLEYAAKEILERRERINNEKQV